MLEIRYTVHQGGQTLLLPAFPDDTAVQKVYLCAFVPPDPGCRGHGRIVGRGFPVAVGKPGPLGAGQHGIARKESGVGLRGQRGALGAAKTFHIDGTPLIFSTLRPDAQTNVAAVDGRHQTLNAWIFGLVVLGGVVLVRTSLARRLLAVAVFVVALVLLGVFWPTLSLHVLGGPLFAAVVIVLLVWAVVGLFRLLSAAQAPV